MIIDISNNLHSNNNAAGLLANYTVRHQNAPLLLLQ